MPLCDQPASTPTYETHRRHSFTKFCQLSIWVWLPLLITTICLYSFKLHPILEFNIVQYSTKGKDKSVFRQYYGHSDRFGDESVNLKGQGNSFAPNGGGGEAKATEQTNKYVLVLDLWERMVNVQGGLLRLVQLGVDADFTVVEPFVYESQVSRQYSVPEHFESSGLRPQPASTYFDVRQLYSTRHLVSYNTFSSVSKLQRNSTNVYIDAVLYFDWENTTAAQPGSSPFEWCDSKLSTEFGMKKEERPNGWWKLSDHVFIRRAVSVNPRSITMEPRNFTASFFNRLFAFISRGKRRTSRCDASAANCYLLSTSIAFINYRKHAFNGYTSISGLQPFKTKLPALAIGREPKELAARLIRKTFGRRPFIALQMRTGKAWVLTDQNPVKFSEWLNECVGRSIVAVRTAKKALDGLNGNVGVYLASDMYNEGWRGGEKCPQEVSDALEEAKFKLDESLRPSHFDPKPFDIDQDLMGIASAVDAAMCFKADHFVYASPSSLGRWVDDQRRPLFMPKAEVIDCAGILERITSKNNLKDK